MSGSPGVYIARAVYALGHPRSGGIMSGNKTYLITMGVCTCLLLLLYILRAVLGKFYRNQLVYCVQQEDLNLYNEIAESKMARLLVPPYNIHYMRLNLYMVKENKKGIDEEFDFLLNLKMGKQKRQDIVIKAFNYYVKEKDSNHSKPLLEEMRTFMDDNSRRQYEMLYDIYILKKSCYIDELEKGVESDQLPMAQKAIYEYLIALQYENRSQPKLAKEHEERSAAYLQEAVEKAQKEAEEAEEEDYDEDYDEDEEDDEESAEAEESEE